MTGSDRDVWLGALYDDPAFRAAWETFRAQLARDSGLLHQGVRPTGQALREAARAVYVAAGLDMDQADDGSYDE